MEDLDRKVFAALQSDVERALEPRRTSGVRSLHQQANFRVWLDEGDRSERLMIENIGNAAANNLRIIKSEAVGDGGSLDLIEPEPVGTLQPDNRVGFPVAISFGTAAQHDLVLGWDEGEHQFEQTHSLTVF